ncbi:MAG: DUF1080 domain-containing protein [Chitinophagaceae bacterium]|nr:DUF1080 domain-containing protein [Chitinophagaceae bacterium]
MRKFLLAPVLVLLFSIPSHAQEAGWTSLFDGKTFNGWKKLAGNAEYQIENGVIIGVTVNNEPNTFLTTEKEYGDFVLEMEVMLQDSTLNSGIQFRSHFNPEANNGKGRVYGYQFELDPSSRKWFGGIYDEARRGWLYPLSLNTLGGNAFKPDVYNKVRIECVGNIIQTFVNGQKTACLIDAEDAKGFIALQVHSINKTEQAGKKIYWKNIRIKTDKPSLSPTAKEIYVVNLIPNDLSSIEKKNGWRLLFDGKSAKGWKKAYGKGFPEKGWTIKDGTFTVQKSDGGESTNGGDIVTEEKFHAFDFTFDFKLTPGANSGIKYFVTLSENNKGSAIGLEYQALDDKAHPDAKEGVNGNRTLASLYDLIPANKNERFVNPPGQWNRGRIIVYPDNHVEHYLNGMKVLEYERGSQQFRDLVAVSKYKIWKNFGEADKGHLLLQDHGDEVSFRSLKIRELR